MRANEFRQDLDEDLLTSVEGGEDWAHRVSEVSELRVVVGRGGRSEREVFVDTCAADGVPILRRRGGGGAVVLASGCLVVSLAARVDRELDVGSYLNQIAEFLAKAIGRRAALSLGRLGMGDVCAGDRKVLGASLFRRRQLLFYQASLLHSFDLSLVDRYLAHPPREPEYRRGRTHGEFLTTLKDAGAVLSAGEVCEGLDRDLEVLAGSRPW